MSENEREQEEGGPIEAYQRAFRTVDRDALHDAIVNRGMSVLAMGLPYLIIAARWEERSRQRTEARRGDKLRHVQPEELGLIARLDAHAVAESNQDLHRVLGAISRLDDADAVIIWGHFEGRSDAEIRELLLGRGMPALSPSAIRKRRQRALERIRADLGLNPSSAGESEPGESEPGGSEP